MGTLDVLGLIVACLVVVATLIVLRRGASTEPTRSRERLLRYAAVAALAALMSGVMALLQLRGAGVVALALANATMVYAPAVIWVALRGINRRAAGGMIAASLASIAVFAVTFLGAWEAGGAKVAALAVFCTLAFSETARRPLRDLPGSRLIAATALPYAVFCVLRVGAGLIGGPDSWTWRTFFSTSVTTALGTLAVALICLAVVRMAHALDDAALPASRARRRGAVRVRARDDLRRHGMLVALTLSTPDLDLIRTAYGTARADAVLHALEDAARAALPGALVGPLTRSSVFALTAGDLDHHRADTAIRAAFADTSPRIGYDDVPDVRIVHRGIAEDAQLDQFLHAPSARLRSLLRSSA